MYKTNSPDFPLLPHTDYIRENPKEHPRKVTFIIFTQDDYDRDIHEPTIALVGLVYHISVYAPDSEKSDLDAIMDMLHKELRKGWEKIEPGARYRVRVIECEEVDIQGNAWPRWAIEKVVGSRFPYMNQDIFRS